VLAPGAQLGELAGRSLALAVKLAKSRLRGRYRGVEISVNGHQCILHA
jgi:hypothetical protein